MKELPLKIKVLDYINKWYSKTRIKVDLAITYKWIERIYKELKEWWYTKIQWFWWSWCTCMFTENCNHCECDWNPYVWRMTVPTEKWLILLFDSKN